MELKVIIKESDISVLKGMLSVLVDKGTISKKQTVEKFNVSEEDAARLQIILLVSEFAQRFKTSFIGEVSKTDLTDLALESNHFEILYEEEMLKKERYEQEAEKMKLEIQNLKKNNRITVPAFCFGIAGTVMALIDLLR